MLRAKRGCAAQGRQLVSDLLPLARAAGGAWHPITAGAPHLTLAHVYVSIHEDSGLPGGAAEGRRHGGPPHSVGESWVTAQSYRSLYMI